MYLYMYMYVHTFVYIYICIYIHLYIHIHMHMTTPGRAPVGLSFIVIVIGIATRRWQPHACGRLAQQLTRAHGSGWGFRRRAKKGQLNRCQKRFFESQGQNLALTVICVPYSLDSGRVDHRTLLLEHTLEIFHSPSQCLARRCRLPAACVKSG